MGRSIPIRTTFPDEHIERWAPIFDANPMLHLSGVTLTVFLQDPAGILRSAMSRPADPVDGFRPLLREQEVVMSRLLIAETLEDLEQLDDELADGIQTTGHHPVHREDGRLVEPLAHNKHPDRRGLRSNFKRRARVCQ